MDKKQRLFIYGRKEVGILFLLGITVAVFAFTLGVHLGKRVGVEIPAQSHSDPTPVATSADKTPNSQELAEQGKSANQAAEESLNQALHDEVARRGIKLDDQKQVELPKVPRSDNGGATTLGEPKTEAPAAHPSAETHAQAQEESQAVGTYEADHEAEAPAPAQQESRPAAHEQKRTARPIHAAPPAAKGKFTVQVGSHATVSEAQAQADQIEKQGLKPFLRPAEVRGIGKRYRVFVGGFATREQAQKAGEGYRSQNLIDSFIVSKFPQD